MPGEKLWYSYGRGSSKANRPVYIDTVQAGGVTVQSQAVGCSNSLSSDFLYANYMDGILGLAFNSGSKSMFDEITQNPLATASPMSQSIYPFYLR